MSEKVSMTHKTHDVSLKEDTSLAFLLYKQNFEVIS